MPLFSFNLLSYPNNPSFWQIGQQVKIQPAPGFSAVSYALTGPSLPLGISFNTETGVFSGSPTALTPATILSVTATLANSQTSTCQVTISVVDIPVPAVEANQNSATGLNNLKLIAEQNWIASVSAMVENANTLGQFWITAELPQYVSFNFCYFYLTRLNFVVQNLSPSQNDGEFASMFGQFSSFPGSLGDEWFGPWGPNYNDFTQPYALVRSRPVRKVRISWTPWRGWLPFEPWYGNYPF